MTEAPSAMDNHSGDNFPTERATVLFITLYTLVKSLISTLFSSKNDILSHSFNYVSKPTQSKINSKNINDSEYVNHVKFLRYINLNAYISKIKLVVYK